LNKHIFFVWFNYKLSRNHAAENGFYQSFRKIMIKIQFSWVKNKKVLLLEKKKQYNMVEHFICTVYKLVEKKNGIYNGWDQISCSKRGDGGRC